MGVTNHLLTGMILQVGGGFKYFLFSPWGNDPIKYFSKGLVQPPTRDGWKTTIPLFFSEVSAAYFQGRTVCQVSGRVNKGKQLQDPQGFSQKSTLPKFNIAPEKLPSQ